MKPTDLRTEVVIFLVHTSVLLRDISFSSELEIHYDLLEGVNRLTMGVRALAICDLSTHLVDPIIVFAILRGIPIISEIDVKTYSKALVRPLVALDYEGLRPFDLTALVLEQVQTFISSSSNRRLSPGTFGPISRFPTQIYFLSTRLSTQETSSRIEDEVQWPIVLSTSNPKIHGYLVIPDVIWERLKKEESPPSYINHVLPLVHVPSNAKLVVLKTDPLLPSCYDLLLMLLKNVQVQNQLQDQD